MSGHWDKNKKKWVKDHNDNASKHKPDPIYMSKNDYDNLRFYMRHHFRDGMAPGHCELVDPQTGLPRAKA